MTARGRRLGPADLLSLALLLQPFEQYRNRTDEAGRLEILDDGAPELADDVLLDQCSRVASVVVSTGHSFLSRSTAVCAPCRPWYSSRCECDPPAAIRLHISRH